VIERDISIPAGSFQLHENRVIRAATFFAEGARLLHEESFELLNLRQAARLRLISNAVQRLVSALQRIGRVTKSEVPPERIAQQFLPAGDLASREAVL